jgi:hypothetical protein
MSAIIRNSARCNHCGQEIESTHRHDFRPHYCPKVPRKALAWVDGVLSQEPELTFNFAVDGGKAYIRRLGEPTEYTDTSEFTDQEAI